MVVTDLYAANSLIFLSLALALALALVVLVLHRLEQNEEGPRD